MTVQSGIATSTSLLGAMLGSVLTFAAKDKLGRKTELLIAACLYGKPLHMPHVVEQGVDRCHRPVSAYGIAAFAIQYIPDFMWCRSGVHPLGSSCVIPYAPGGPCDIRHGLCLCTPRCTGLLSRGWSPENTGVLDQVWLAPLVVLPLKHNAM